MPKPPFALMDAWLLSWCMWGWCFFSSDKNKWATENKGVLKNRYTRYRKSSSLSQVTMSHIWEMKSMGAICQVDKLQSSFLLSQSYCWIIGQPCTLFHMHWQLRRMWKTVFIFVFQKLQNENGQKELENNSKNQSRTNLRIVHLGINSWSHLLYSVHGAQQKNCSFCLDLSGKWNKFCSCLGYCTSQISSVETDWVSILTDAVMS